MGANDAEEKLASPPASIPAKWLCQRPSCSPVLLEWSRAPPLHPLSPSHEQQYSPGGKWEDLVPSRAKNELKLQQNVGFSSEVWIKSWKKKKDFRHFHGPSITSQHPGASLGNSRISDKHAKRSTLSKKSSHKFCLKPLPPQCPEKSCTLPI